MKDIQTQPGKWTVYFDDSRPSFFKLRWRCGDFRKDNVYGKTPYCPYCGKRKTDVPLRREVMA